MSKCSKLAAQMLGAVGLYDVVERATRDWRKARQRPAWVEFFASLIPADSLVFDVGANEGHFALTMRALNAQVVAVEPQAACVERLNRLAAHDAALQVVAAAAGACPGWAEIRMSSHSELATLSERWTSESRYASSHEWSSSERVRVVTLDALIAEFGRPRFCKIDVEGYEVEVLKGLSSPIELISFEFTAEIIDAVADCLAEVSRACGDVRCAYAKAGTPALAADRLWIGKDQFVEALAADVHSDPSLVGDVYVRMVDAGRPPQDCPSPQG